MRRAVVVVLAGVLVLIPMAGAQAATKPYRTCAQVHKDYSLGIARSRTDAAAIASRGFDKPTTSTRLYRANKRLDKDKDGVICPVRTNEAPATPAGRPDPFTIQSTGMATVDAALKAEIVAGRMSEHQFRYLWTALYIFANNPGYYCPDYATPEGKAALLATQTTSGKLSSFGLDASHTAWAVEKLTQYLPMTCAAKGFPIA